MREIIALNHVTLDGVIQSGGGPQEDTSGGFTLGGWSIPFRSADSAKAVLDVMSREFDLLLGRRTYGIWAAFCPMPIIPSRAPSTRRQNTLSRRASAAWTGRTRINWAVTLWTRSAG